MARVRWGRLGLVGGGALLLVLALWGGYRFIADHSKEALQAASAARSRPLPSLRAPVPPPRAIIAREQPAEPASRPAEAQPAPLSLPPAEPKPSPARTETAAVAPEAGRQETPQAARTFIAIIIDDVGLNPAAARRAIGLPAPVTLAFLPYGDETPELARAAKAAGHEVFVHLQMAPEGHADPGPKALLAGLDDKELRARTDWALSRVPGAVGANNHMGSRLTADDHAMRVVLGELDRHGMAFIDSRTSARSVAEQTARSLGVPASRRDVFLDNEQDAGAINAQLEATLKLARQHGSAVAIGHPHPATLAALAAWLPAMQKAGIVFVHATDLIDIRRCRTADAGSAAVACAQAARLAAAPG